MTHTFIASNENKIICATCGYGPIAHTNFATCDNGHKAVAVNIVNGKLLCHACETDNLLSDRTRLNSDSEAIAISEQNVAQSSNQTILQSQQIDRRIKSNGDVFNSPTVPLIELKRSIDNDASITNKDERFNEVCLERYMHLCDKIFELNDAVLQAEREKMEIKENLREIGGKIRKEIQDRISTLDNNYQPLKKPITAKVPKKNLSVFDRMAQMLMMANPGMTMDEARDKMIKGGLAHPAKITKE
jgi:hypothetical protein